MKLIYLISRVFLAWTFLNFLAHCELAAFETNFVHCVNKVALIAEEASKYLAKAYNLSKDEVTFGLPLSDVRGTRLSTLCQIKVDFPCQPGKYRAYNGYCNNVQNPNWGVANRRFLRYKIIEFLRINLTIIWV